jgi:hypothetical protein
MFKPFFFLVFTLLMGVTSLFSQSKVFWNRWTTGANILYLGIDNELRAAAGMEKILSARSTGATIQVSSDSASLVVRPSVFGTVTVHIRTLSDSLSVTYQANFLPLPQIGLGDAGFNIGFLSHRQLAEVNGLKLRGHRAEQGKIYDQCQLSCFEIQIGEQVFSGYGPTFSPEIMRALQQLRAGDKIIIRSLFLEPMEGGRPIRLEPARVIMITE